MMFSTTLPLVDNTITAFASETSTKTTATVAEDTTVSEGKGLSESQANIYASGNSLALDALKKVSEYDIALQYEITYNILNDTYNTSANSSKYSDITQGNSNGAFEGTVGTAVGTAHSDLNTDALGTVSKLVPSTDSDAANVNGDGVVNVIEGSSDVATNPEQISADLKVLQSAFAATVVDALYEKLITGLGVSYDSFVSSAGMAQDVIAFDSGSGTEYVYGVNANTTIENAIVSEVGYTLVDLTKTPVIPETEQKQMKEALQGATEKYLDSHPDKFTVDSIPTILSDAESSYLANYTTVKEVTLQDPSGWDSDVSIIGGIVESFNRSYWVESEGVKTIKRDTVMVVEFNKADKATKEVAASVATQSLSLIYNHLNKDSKTLLNDDLKKSIDSLVKTDAYKKMTDFTSANKVTLTAGGTHLITWTPLVASYEQDAINDEFKEMLTKYDKSTVSGDGSALTKYNSDRGLETGDIFLNVENESVSPVLYGVGDAPDKFLTTLAMGGLAGGSTKSTNAYIKYAGYSYEDTTNGFLDYFTKLDADAMAITSDEFATKAQTLTYPQSIMNVITANPESTVGKSFADLVKDSDRTVGVDSYGNVIDGSDGAILIPYYQNDFINGTSLASLVSSSDSAFLSHPVLTTAVTSTDAMDLLENIASYTPKEGTSLTAKDKEGLALLFGGPMSDEVATKLETARKAYANAGSNETAIAAILNGQSGDKEDILRAIAAVITAKTYTQVKEFNNLVLTSGEKNSKLYISSSNAGFNGGTSADSVAVERWTAASLIQKIGFIFDYGFGDTIRLGFAQAVTGLYATSITDAALSSVFYTKTVTENASWSDMLLPLATILSGVMGVYLIVLGFKLYRKQIKAKDIVKQFVMLALVLLIPTYVYGPVINFLLNDPTQWILGKQMKQTAILDTYLALDNKSRDLNEYYANMFGASKDIEDISLGDYTIYFYTTTDREGFDINTTNPDAYTTVNADNSKSTLAISSAGRSRLKAYQNGVRDYPKEHLVKVAVSLTDVYRWVWDANSGGDPNNTSNLTSKEHDSLTYDDAISDDPNVEGKVNSLFKWLAHNGNASSFPVEGYDSEIGGYTEYAIDTSRSFENTKNVEGVKAPEGEDITASELFYTMVYNASEEDVSENLPKLADISEMVNFTEKNQTQDTYVVTEEDITDLVRDLSLTDDDRFKYFGSAKFSQFTSNVIVGGKSNLDLGKPLGVNPQLTAPKEDFLGLDSLVARLVPYRGVYSSYYTNLEQDVFNINSNLLTNYLSTYSITKASLDIDSRNSDVLNKAEMMIMVTEAYFQLNDVLKFNNFPQDFEPESITFDKYLTLIYMPLVDYGEATLNFLDSNPVVPANLAEYLALSQNTLVLLLFLVTIMLLIIFGVAYMLVFMFLMMIVIMYTFIKNYVVKNNWDNKAWLGELMIIGGFSVVKSGLLLLWYGLTYFMNKSVAMGSTSYLTYPHALVASLSVSAYLIFAFFTVFKPMAKAVVSDKENLGGQVFADGLSGIVGRVTGRGPSNGGVGGNAAKKSVNGEGAKGKLADKLRNSSLFKKRTARVVGTGGGTAGSTIVGRKAKEAVKSLKEKLNSSNGPIGTGVVNSWRSMKNIPRNAINATKRSYNNKAAKSMASKTSDVANNIVQTTQGVADEVMKTAVVGSVIGEVSKGKMTEMAVQDALVAAVMAENLAKKGIRAVVQDKNLFFDSTGYDLTDSGVRSELFNDSVSSIQGVAESTFVKAEVNNLEMKNKHLFKVNEDGTYSVNFGKAGLSPEGFNQLFNSNEFKSNFVVPDITSRNLNKHGLLTGDIKLTPAGDVKGEKAIEAIHNLFDVDEQIREENNYSRRLIPKLSQSATLSNIGVGQIHESVEPLLAEGMYLQGNKILFNSNDLTHRGAISDIKKTLQATNEDSSKSVYSKSDKLLSFITQDGENKGFLVNNSSTDNVKNSQMASILFKGEDVVGAAVKYKIADDNQGLQIKNSLLGLQNLVNLGKKDASSIDNYREVQNTLATTGDSILTKDGSDYRNAISHASTYFSSHNYDNSPSFKQIKEDLGKIDVMKSKNQITDDEYNLLNKSVYDQIQNFAVQTGELNGLFLDAVKPQDSLLANQFINSRSNLASQAKVATNVIDKVNVTPKELNDLGNTLNGVHSVTSKDGVLSIKTKKRTNSKNGGFKNVDMANKNISQALDKLDVFDKNKDNADRFKSNLVTDFYTKVNNNSAENNQSNPSVKGTDNKKA